MGPNSSRFGHQGEEGVLVAYDVAVRARREGAYTTNFEGPHQTLRAQREGTYDKLRRDRFLLLQCSESANVRNNIGFFCACIEPFRRAITAPKTGG